MIKRRLASQNVKLRTPQPIEENGLITASKHKALLDCGL
jgi:hypothetical protein